LKKRTYPKLKVKKDRLLRKGKPWEGGPRSSREFVGLKESWTKEKTLEPKEKSPRKAKKP